MDLHFGFALRLHGETRFDFLISLVCLGRLEEPRELVVCVGQYPRGYRHGPGSPSCSLCKCRQIERNNAEKDLLRALLCAEMI